jgi:hypothetical protein
MALFILCIVGLLAPAALLWCLAGFTRALKEKPKMIGLLIRVENSDTSTTRRREQRTIPFPDRGSLPQEARAARFQKYSPLKLLILGGVAMLLASPGARANLSGMTSVISRRNSEIQKAVFVELSKMRVQSDS